MKNYILTLTLVCIAIFSVAQKVDIDNFRINIKTTKFPLNYIPENERSFSTKITGPQVYRGQDKEEQVNIFGWNKTNENPDMDVEVNMSSFRRGQPQLSNKVEEKKDKDGKVISRTTYYWVSVSNTGIGLVKVFGKKNELPVVLSKKQMEKQKAKEAKEKEKKDKEIADNPFLQNVETEVEEVKEVTSSKKEHVYSQNISQSYVYETGRFTSANQAWNDYRSNNVTQANNHENTYISSYLNSINSFLNDMYGYGPFIHYAKFKKLDSEKHPEYTMFDNATKAMKLILEKMRYNQPIDQIEKDMTPIISYFDGIIKKYNKDEKGDKKMKYAAQYNLARIFQFLDRHDKTIEIGKVMIADDYEKKDGERFVEQSTEFKRKLEFHRMTNRHIVPRNANDEKDVEGEAGEEEEED
ncbi:MAG: hypothetical protein IPL63_02140 [Saprospiraceae bacterium]|nr:hypothetical protein [Saprospiraceae bacterium]MBK8079949.1 hypothetical protein [Saprospiraceae bacterium]MBK8370913.1 hypothetical protein [Saprospiraceae bacterium]MBK8546214.1 hypothetical protein [Saprospiraceae bacterium]MBK8854243.1 hypothetical protein [Saprospiraceae bacterium]